VLAPEKIAVKTEKGQRYREEAIHAYASSAN
jgi:hypothetical protein